MALGLGESLSLRLLLHEQCLARLQFRFGPHARLGLDGRMRFGGPPFFGQSSDGFLKSLAFRCPGGGAGLSADFQGHFFFAQLFDLRVPKLPLLFASLEFRLRLQPGFAERGRLGLDRLFGLNQRGHFPFQTEPGRLLGSDFRSGLLLKTALGLGQDLGFRLLLRQQRLALLQFGFRPHARLALSERMPFRHSFFIGQSGDGFLEAPTFRFLRGAGSLSAGLQGRVFFGQLLDLRLSKQTLLFAGLDIRFRLPPGFRLGDGLDFDNSLLLGEIFQLLTELDLFVFLAGRFRFLLLLDEPLLFSQAFELGLALQTSRFPGFGVLCQAEIFLSRTSRLRFRFQTRLLQGFSLGLSLILRLTLFLGKPFGFGLLFETSLFAGLSFGFRFFLEGPLLFGQTLLLRLLLQTGFLARFGFGLFLLGGWVLGFRLDKQLWLKRLGNPNGGHRCRRRFRLHGTADFQVAQQSFHRDPFGQAFAPGKILGSKTVLLQVAS